MRRESEEAKDKSGRDAALASLRARICGGHALREAGAVLPLGIGTVDAHLPGGGLGLGVPHEVAPDAEGDEAAALGFTLALVARRLVGPLAGPAGEALLVIAPGHTAPYGHGLRDLGLDPSRLLLFEVGTDADAYRAIEEALRVQEPGQELCAVAGLVDGGLALKPGRRLQLAAQGTRCLLVVLRPAGAACANGAATRWRVGSHAATRDRFGTLANPCWRVRLDRCRNGRPGAWHLEWDHAAHRFGLAGALAGHAPEAFAAGSAGRP